MTQVVSSISGIQIYAPSAGFAPTNSADVSAIASGYQVVSSTSTELYAGTAFLTGVNSAQVSASRAGQAANASMANSAYYDGTGRLISALPDSATVSAIASSYAESAASAKQDTLSFSYDDDKISAINGSALAGGITGDYLTSKVGSGRATFTTAFQDGMDKRPALCINGERGVDSAVYPRMLITDWNRSTGDTHSGTLLANAFEFYTCPTSARGEVDPSGVLLARLDDNKVEFNLDSSVTSKNRSAQYGRGGIFLGVSGASGSSIQIVNEKDAAPYIVIDDNSGVTGRIDPSSMGYWNSKLDGSASSSFYTTANESGYVDSAYVDSAISGKQDSLAFAYDADSAISSINGSALAGGGAPIVVTGTSWNPDTSAWVYDSTSNLSGLERHVWTLYNGGKQDYINYIKDDSGNRFTMMASLLEVGAEQYAGALSSRFVYMPRSSMWTTAGDATGVFSPLQYATGACLAMDAATYFKAYYKGNEWFVTDTRYGMLRGEVHKSRGLRIVASGTNSASGFQLHPSGVDGVDTNGYSWRYGTAEYTQLTSVHDTVSANSASWGGGVDSATVSAIASSYAESAASGKMDTSAIDYTRTGDGVQIYASGTGSSTNQFSAYNDSAGAAIIAAKNARIRLWDTAATANVYASSVGGWNAVSDLVSAQSANWGASALQIAAGPGIKLTKSGNVLFVENDVTVLYEAENVTNNTAGQVFTMSESVLNFSRLRITCENMEFPTRPFTQEYPVFNSSSTFVSPWQNGGTPPSLNIPYSQYSINGDGNLVCDKRGLLYGSLSNPQHTDVASRGYCLMKVEGLDRIYADYE